MPPTAETTPSFDPTKHHTSSLLELVLHGEITWPNLCFDTLGPLCSHGLTALSGLETNHKEAGMAWTPAEALNLNPAWTLSQQCCQVPGRGSTERGWAWHLHHSHLHGLLQMATTKPWIHPSSTTTQTMRSAISHGNDHEWVLSTWWWEI